MTDTLFQLIRDTITLHDTLMDTVLVANKGSNNSSLIPVMSGLVLFGLTLIKDLIFHKKKDISEQNKYKFEKAHLKNVEIMEKLYSDFIITREKLMIINDYFPIMEAQDKVDAFQDIDSRLKSIDSLTKNGFVYLEEECFTIVRDLLESIQEIFQVFREDNKNGVDLKLKFENITDLLVQLGIIVRETIKK
jgi:hypothetical protein